MKKFILFFSFLCVALTSFTQCYNVVSTNTAEPSSVLSSNTTYSNNFYQELTCTGNAGDTVFFQFYAGVSWYKPSSTLPWTQCTGVPGFVEIRNSSNQPISTQYSFTYGSYTTPGSTPSVAGYIILNATLSNGRFYVNAGTLCSGYAPDFNSILYTRVQTSSSPTIKSGINGYEFAGEDKSMYGTISVNAGIPPIPPVNDEFVNALSLQPSVNMTCSNTSGTLVNATPSTISTLPGADTWYKFVAPSSAVSIQCSSISNISLELFTNTTILIATENATSTGNEILNIDGLTPGVLYYLCVNTATPNTTISGLCVKRLIASESALLGTVDRCGNFKAKYTAANGYVFHFGTEVYATPISLNAASTIFNLSLIQQLAYSTTYPVTVDAVYNVVDGAGNSESITVVGTVSTNITIASFTPVFLRSTDAMPFTRYVFDYIATNTFVCSVQSYDWKFTEVDVNNVPVSGGLSNHITNLGTSNRYLLINSTNIPGVAAGKYYRVSVRPIFLNGNIGVYGAEYVMQIAAAPSAMVLSESDQEVINEMILRTEETEQSTTTIYPNPSSGIVTVSAINSENGTTQITCYNSIGQIVYNEFRATNAGLFVTQLDLEPGVYIVEIKLSNKSITERLIIQ